MTGAGGVRTGLGWDSHRFKAGRALILGGIEFEGAELGLDGHSDADVLTHAVMDALLGAAGLGDIGVHFPDTDGAYQDADSIELLRSVVATLASHGLAATHVDTTVLMERPKIGPYRDAIRSRLAEVLGIEAGAVNVKASTGEGMGFVGRLEGVAALAVATVGPREPLR
jgi:2-C-methyl-D-erythritol 2,4-cyclodiphosphate synthase